MDGPRGEVGACVWNKGERSQGGTLGGISCGLAQSSTQMPRFSCSLTPYMPSMMGARIRRKLTGQDKVQQEKQKLCVQGKQHEQFAHSLPWAGRGSAISRKAALQHICQ